MDGLDGNGGSRVVATELSHIKDLVMQLETHLSGSPDLCKQLASQIFCLTERSIGIITSSSFDGGRKRSAAGSPTPSPLSDVVDVPFKTTKKRKVMEKKNQVRVSSGAGGETPVDDGHSWRKYGQKEILGAKHPRAYYRCTHKHSKGCTATKQMQRTDEDPALFDVFYLGTHTCGHKTAAAAGQATQQPPAHNPDAHSLLQSLSATLTVKTEGLAAATGASTPFFFSSTPASECLAPESSPFSAPSSQNWGMSPATSDSNYASSFPFFDGAAAGDEAVVSALVAASVPAVDIDEFLNMEFFV
ncbi:EcWRKY-71 [Eragrostis curvula]|uniref:EcWRKY-65 n=1 Tax=Eragrostis curvula TaxID=38414 RepID=A0A5J9TD18_9POAL|nr:EcWRKY-65 [Eragrostis curvula]TVU09204.1 EcWRKY-71 [Eragrostis curvula]